MTDETYKRGQVEQALWRFFTAGRSASAEIPRVFQVRIKKLLELDRQGKAYASQAPHADYAFHDEKPAGTGTDILFSPFNAFCLAVALDMVDAGFNPAEVLYLLRHIVDALEAEYHAILADPPRVDKMPKARDLRRFVIVERLEATEILPLAVQEKIGAEPLFLAPKFVIGSAGVQAELDKIRPGRRKAFVLELAYAATLVTQFLPEAPLTKRGRPEA